MTITINGQEITGTDKEIKAAIRKAKKEEDKKAKQEEVGKRESDRECLYRFYLLCSHLGHEWPRGWRLVLAHNVDYRACATEFSVLGCYGSSRVTFYDRLQELHLIEAGDGSHIAIRIVMRDGTLHWYALGIDGDYASTLEFPKFIADKIGDLLIDYIRYPFDVQTVAERGVW